MDAFCTKRLIAERLRAEQRFVGRAGLKNAEVNGRNEVDLAYALLPEFWGRGLATEIAGTILKIAFEKLGLREVICYTLATNLASRRVMEKSGFRFERDGIHVGLPHVFYRLTAAEFSANGRNVSSLPMPGQD